ncbi:MAG: sigma 54-interacting transcriptional regulator [Proteobacteria bacterium]|nr:sigma 54-interacting transcriptional regulator [Pseudomonadota bacterium]
MGRTILRKPDKELVDFYGIITVAPEMQEFFALVSRVAATESTVLIRGETGTGKELVARAIHKLSGRARRPFRALNCATLTPELLASELFGHVRGAFTGAVRDRRGLFSLADTGTVFLDEVAELPLDIQARLLRVLQEQTFVPLGGTDPITVDVRLISATHQALRRGVTERRFREDLMYRLRVVPIFLPPLRQRSGDIEALAWHFIDQFNQRGGRVVEAIDDPAMAALLAYPWPGNVRELRNVVEYAFAIGVEPVISLADLTPELRGEPPSDEPASPGMAERQRIERALHESGGRKSLAAERLGMSRSTLWRKMRELKITGWPRGSPR